VGCRFITLSG